MRSLRDTAFALDAPAGAAWWRRSAHYAGQTPEPFSAKVHSADDDSLWPDHWIIYLSGLNLSAEPADNDPLSSWVWSWGREYEVSCTVEAFSEYLYAGATGAH